MMIAIDEKYKLMDIYEKRFGVFEEWYSKFHILDGYYTK